MHLLESQNIVDLELLISQFGDNGISIVAFISFSSLSLSGVITHNNYHRAANRKHGFLIPLSDTGTTKAECIGVQNWMSTGPYQRQVTQN